MFDLTAHEFVEGVNAKAVFVGIDDREQRVAKKKPLVGFDEAFE